MVVEPSGTVSFLFTDVEGSTALWESDADAMRTALERHDELIRKSVDTFGGSVFSTGGDGFAVAFGRAGDAVAAAIDAQMSLGRLKYPVALRVRMGVHTGEATERDGDYFGSAVNRAARLMAVGHGGQLLCSGVTAAIVAETLPDGCSLIDLGLHRLRDLSSPEHIHQVVVPGGAETFPPLRSLDAFRGNLPVQATAFIGRGRDIHELGRLFGEARVITLTGVGGVGKTRLALQLAADVLPSFRDGAWFVELAGVVSADGVQDATGTVLGFLGGTGLAAGLVEYLRPKELLLILDNCEHLLSPVADFVEQVVRSAPGVRVLATSREGLGVSGEYLRTVPSLELPGLNDTTEGIQASDAVRLFNERAQEASAGYELTARDAPVVAELCRRLDGIPLAIELAAARVPALTPSEIAAHLDRRFRLLTGGRRSAVTRHQTLRNAMEWSYELLVPEEQIVLARLSVFSGGFDLCAAQAVAFTDAIEPVDVLDIVSRLVSKSLVVAEARDGTTRYRLLETVRDFAWEQLQAGAATEEVARKHAEFFAGFARDAGSGLRGPDEAEWRQRVEREVDNLRAGLSWAVAAGDVDLALKPVSDLAVLGDGLAPYGLLAESAARLAEDHPLAPVALGAGCWAATMQGDFDRALQLAGEARRSAERLDRTPEGLWVRCRVANATCVATFFDPEGYEDALSSWLNDARELGDSWCLGEALTFGVGGGIADLDEGIAAGEEALLITRAIGAPSRVAFAAVFLAARLANRDPQRKDALLHEAATASKKAGNDWVDYVTMNALTQLHVRTGNLRAAAETAITGFENSLSNRAGGHVVQFVGMLTCVLAAAGDEDGAMVLAAWAEQRGLANPATTFPIAADDLANTLARRSPDELERIAQNAASLDDAGVARFAHERVTALSTRQARPDTL